MPSYLNPTQFTAYIEEHSALDLVRDYLFTGLPYVFRHTPKAYDTLKVHLSTHLEIGQENIFVVGSARTGFSLGPNSFPRQFNNSSDIDVIIVDQHLFDTLWHAVLKWHYPRKRIYLESEDYQWVGERKTSIYWGWFYPDKISYEGPIFPNELRPIRDLAAKWFSAFRTFALYFNYPDLARRTISGRLYRTMEHAWFYHEDSLRQLCARLPPRRV